MATTPTQGRGQAPGASLQKNGASPQEMVLSAIDEVRRRKGTTIPAGELGQVRSVFYYLLAQHLGVPNPDKLDVETYKKMEKDPMVRGGIAIRELAILAKPGGFNYAPRDKDDPEETELGAQMVSFLKWVWENLTPNPTTFLRYLLTARRYGFSVVEKVWATDPPLVPDGKPTVHLLPPGHEFEGFAYIEKVKLLPADSLEKHGFAVDEYGNIFGVVQTLHHYQRPPGFEHLGGAIPAPRSRNNLGYIDFRGHDLDRLIIYRANFEDANPYGTSDLQAAYNNWYSKQANHAARNILLERLSGVVIGKYDNPSEQGELEEALDEIGPGAVITVPKGSEVEILAGWEQAVEGFHRSIEYDDRQVLQALLVPPLTIGGQASEGGSFARAASNFDSFMVVARNIQLELEEAIEEGFIKPLIDANFPGVTKYPSFDFPEIQEKDRSKLATVWGQAIRDGYVDPRIDAAWLRAELGVPEDAPEDWVFSGPPKTSEATTPAQPVFAVKAQRGKEAPRSRFEDEEAHEANALIVDRNEAAFRSRVSDAALLLLDRILENVPESSADVDQLDVPKDWLEAILDDLARDTLDRVTRHMASAFEGANGDAGARVKTLTAKATRKGLWRRVKAQDGDEARIAYEQWFQQFNDLKSQQISDELRSRLRIRVLQGYSIGLTLKEIRRAIQDEFTSYMTQQLDTASRTIIMDYFNAAREATYDAAGDFVQGVKFVPLLDTATTPFCRELINRSISKKDPLYSRLASPPFWYNCRTMTVPILADEKWEFDTDWQEWLQNHRDVEGGGFIYGSA